MLALPFDEVARAVFEGQEIEADDGAGAQIRALSALRAALTGGDDG